MSTAIILIILGVACYFLSIFLIRYYIERSSPGLLDQDLAMPKPQRGQEYLWEKTAGTGVVPKWVSVIGLLAYPLFFFGLIMLVLKIF